MKILIFCFLIFMGINSFAGDSKRSKNINFEDPAFSTCTGQTSHETEVVDTRFARGTHIEFWLAVYDSKM